MLKLIAAAGMTAILLSACSTQSLLPKATQPPEKQALTMADVLPFPRPESPEEKLEQEKFIKESKDRFISTESGAAYFVLGARRTFNEQKLDSAAYLFGRAWLLDSTNIDILWGYGLVFGQQKQFDKSLFILYKALEADKENPRLLTDIATSHMGRFYEESNPDDLLQSRKQLKKAVSFSPKNTDAFYKLAINCYYLKEYRKAWEYLHTSLRINKEVADKKFIAALLEKQHDPQGIYTQQNIH